MTAPTWAVSLHDVAPATWGECEQLLEMLRHYAAPATLLVTPHYRRGIRLEASAPCSAALRRRVRAGDEIVLHGYSHADEGPPATSPSEWAMRRVWTDREGEFAALDAAAAGRRLDAGLALLEECGLPPAGFVAPAWLLGAGARAALARRSFRYTCTRDALLTLPHFQRLSAPSLVYSTRAPWRRALSRHWNRRRLATFAELPRVRVALHPADARYPRVLDDWRRLLDVLARTRLAVLETAWLPPTRGLHAGVESPCATSRADTPLRASA